MAIALAFKQDNPIRDRDIFRHVLFHHHTFSAMRNGHEKFLQTVLLINFKQQLELLAQTDSRPRVSEQFRHKKDRTLTNVLITGRPIKVGTEVDSFSIPQGA